jgi:hypothetical protein
VILLLLFSFEDFVFLLADDGMKNLYLEVIINSDVITWTPTIAFRILSKLLGSPAQLQMTLHLGVIPFDSKAARTWLCDPTTGQSLLHTALRCGSDTSPDVFPILTALGLSMSDFDNEGHDVWHYLPSPVVQNLRLVVPLLHATSAFFDTSGNSVLHLLFKRRLGEAIANSSAVSVVTTTVREIFALCKQNGVDLTTRDADGHLPLEVSPRDLNNHDSENLERTFYDGTSLMDYRALDAMVAHGIVDRSDLEPLIAATRSVVTQHRILGLMYSRGLIKDGDTIPGSDGTFTKETLEKLAAEYASFRRGGTYPIRLVVPDLFAFGDE